MKLTLQRMLFGLGVSCVLGCGCATPFRPAGWVCYDMQVGDQQSFEYCTVSTQKTNANDVVQHFNSDDVWQSDPFLAIVE